MNKKLVSIIVVAALATLSFAQLKSNDTARVEVELEKAMRQMQDGGEPVSSEEKESLREKIAESISDMDTLKAEALKKGLDKKPEVQIAYQNMEARFYTEALIEDYQKNLKLSAEDVRQAHQLSMQKFKLNEIPYKTKEDAQKGLLKLKKGQSFESLAAEVLKAQYVPYDQLAELNISQQKPEAMGFLLTASKGEISVKPFPTEKGFSLFKVEDITPNAPITDEDFVKHEDALRQDAVMVKTRQYIESVLNK